MVKNGEWSLYWQSGQLDSCLSKNTKDQKVLDDLWVNFASQLPHRAKVVDLATGNGAVISRLNKQRSDLCLWGFDKAKINPPSIFRSNRAIKMMGQTDICQLPVEVGFFDAVTSQFGIEYTSPSQSLREVSRILKPNALLQFIIHHSKSEIVKGHKNKLKELALLLGDMGVMDSLIRFAENRCSTSKLQTSIKKYNQALSHPSQQISGQVLKGIQQLVDLKQQGNIIASYSIDMQVRMKAEHSRLSQLAKAAFSNNQLEQFAARMNDFGLIACTAEPIFLSQKPRSIIAWLVTGMKNVND